MKSHHMADEEITKVLALAKSRPNTSKEGLVGRKVFQCPYCGKAVRDFHSHRKRLHPEKAPLNMSTTAEYVAELDALERTAVMSLYDKYGIKDSVVTKWKDVTLPSLNSEFQTVLSFIRAWYVKEGKPGVEEFMKWAEQHCRRVRSKHTRCILSHFLLFPRRCTLSV